MCPTGKHEHKSRGAAEAQLRSLEKLDNYDRYVMNSGGMGAYFCVKCRGWHVGRLKQNAHINKYR